MTQYLTRRPPRRGSRRTPRDEEMQQAFADTDAFNQELHADGSWVFGGGLTEPSDATVVDATKGEPIITDGPFAETKEQLGGFWVVEAPDLDAALDYRPARVGRVPAARRGPAVPGRVSAGARPRRGLPRRARTGGGQPGPPVRRPRPGRGRHRRGPGGRRRALARPTGCRPTRAAGSPRSPANKALDRHPPGEARQDKYAEVATHGRPTTGTTRTGADRARWRTTGCGWCSPAATRRWRRRTGSR